MAKIQLWGYRCERCGHVWLPRHQSPNPDGEGQAEPRICPRCKSAYWNVPKQPQKLKAQEPKAGAEDDRDGRDDNKTATPGGVGRGRRAKHVDQAAGEEG